MKKSIPLFLSVVLLTIAIAACTRGPDPVLPQVLTALPTEKPAVGSPPADASLGDTWTRPAEGMVMVYVPGGTFQMGSDVNDPGIGGDEFPRHSVTLDGFWIDRTEVSVAQFRRFVTETGYETEAEREGKSYVWAEMGWSKVEGADWQHPRGPGSNTQDDHPAVQVSWNDAVAYCEWAGGRLPTEAEWEYAARGPENFLYPWGNEFSCSHGNFDDETEYDGDVVPAGEGCDGYVETSPVGYFPAGASWCEALDMAGNVWEWVADWYDEGYYVNSPSYNPTGPERGEYRVVRGGGWDSNPMGVRAADRSGLRPSDRVFLYGFRCVVPPSGLVPTPAPPPTPTQRPAPLALPIDASLGDTWTRSTDGMAMVYVPDGAFQMGSEETDPEAELNELPRHTVTLDDFWIDRTEVSVGQFRYCVEAGVCQVPVACGGGSPVVPDAPKDDQPVLCVDWQGARTYCEWVGARLPTEAEWEYAARGPQGFLYPWGNEVPDCSKANYNNFVGGTTVVGSYPASASWCGALDMAGNVWEYVADWYDESYYAQSSSHNPTGPITGIETVVRGGSWDITSWGLRATCRLAYPPALRSTNVGFRCASSRE